MCAKIDDKISHKRVFKSRGEKRAKTPEQALNSLMALCARAEKSSGDALRLMKSWGVGEADQRQILSQLQEERFIDDERYATLFIREKRHLNGWGVYKLRTALRLKGISKEIIDEKIEGLDPDEMADRLSTMIEKRARTTKYKTKYQLRDKLIRYGASLGYSFDTVSEAVNNTLNSYTFDTSDNEEESEAF